LVLPLVGLILLAGSTLALLLLANRTAASGVITPGGLLPAIGVGVLWLLLYAVRDALR
jgi:hypothetical protein